MKLIPNLTFKDINKVDWSNPVEEFVFGVSLLFSTYEERPEANEFRKKRSALKAKCLESLGDISELIAEFRKALTIGPIGRTRKETQNTLNNFWSRLLPFAYAAAFNMLGQVTLSNSADPLMSAISDDWVKFSRHYHRDFTTKSLGGTLKIKRVKKRGSCPISTKPPPKTVFNDKRVVFLLDYLADLIKLYYENGLKCWWAPIFQFEDDLAEWSNSSQVVDIKAVTLDGLLGPLFRRQINVPFSDDKRTIPHNFPEYLLAGMSRKEQRRDMGNIAAKDTHETMEQWGYRHGRKWEKRDFDMLFDRLYLRQSVEDIALKYCEFGYDDSTVKRNTKELAILLGIKLPRAKHKKHNIKH